MLAQKEGGMQAGKTRWAHYHIAYHLVWIPKYSHDCSREGDQRTHCRMLRAAWLATSSAGNRPGPCACLCLIPAALGTSRNCESVERLQQFAVFERTFSALQARVRERTHVDAIVLHRHGWGHLSRDHSTLYHGMPGEAKKNGRALRSTCPFTRN